MEKGKKTTVGTMKVSEDVIVKIAQTAALEIEGVSLVRNDGENKLAKLTGKLPVKAKISGETAAIKLDLLIAEGSNAVKAAEDVQKSVKSAVQNMTGFTVTKVDVNIAGVLFKDDSAEVNNGKA